MLLGTQPNTTTKQKGKLSTRLLFQIGRQPPSESRDLDCHGLGQKIAKRCTTRTRTSYINSNLHLLLSLWVWVLVHLHKLLHNTLHTAIVFEHQSTVHISVIKSLQQLPHASSVSSHQKQTLKEQFVIARPSNHQK